MKMGETRQLISMAPPRIDSTFVFLADYGTQIWPIRNSNESWDDWVNRNGIIEEGWGVERVMPSEDGIIYCPADGKVVVIEETEEGEYFKDKRIQVSVFMSPLNVHVNYYPCEGSVTYTKYHPGKFLVAWHPKSSTENERSTVAFKTKSGVPVLMRQIAGAVARRIITYSKPGDNFKAGDQFGFIKFGSRVDMFLPLDAEILVNIDQVVTGSQTPLARIS